MAAKFAIVISSALALGLMQAFSRTAAISDFGRDNPELREFERVFRLCENAALMTLKNSASSSMLTGGSLSIDSFITAESTFGAGIKLPLETLKSSSGAL